MYVDNELLSSREKEIGSRAEIRRGSVLMLFKASDCKLLLPGNNWARPRQ